MSLYPDWFEEEDFMVEEEGDTTSLKKGYEFDFQKGITKTTMSGMSVRSDAYEAYKFWVWKCLHTERFQYPTYSSDFGVEIREIIDQDYDKLITESEIKRTIEEALKIHPHTENVEDFEFRWFSDHLQIRFRLESDFGIDDIRFRKEV